MKRSSSACVADAMANKQSSSLSRNSSATNKVPSSPPIVNRFFESRMTQFNHQPKYQKSNGKKALRITGYVVTLGISYIIRKNKKKTKLSSVESLDSLSTTSWEEDSMSSTESSFEISPSSNQREHSDSLPIIIHHRSSFNDEESPEQTKDKKELNDLNNDDFVFHGQTKQKYGWRWKKSRRRRSTKPAQDPNSEQKIEKFKEEKQILRQKIKKLEVSADDAKTLLQNRIDDLNDEQFQLVLDKIQSTGYTYRQDFAKRYPNPLVHGPGPVYKNLIPDWNNFEYLIPRWTAVPPLQEENWSLDIPYWEPKEASKLMKCVKAMKRTFKLKVCPIQIKTDKNIFTGEWRFFSIPITMTYPTRIDYDYDKLHRKGK